MDLPVRLEDEEFVEGIDEVRQSLIALFNTERGEMMQSKSKGSTSIIHTSLSPIETDLYVTDVCSQVPGVKHLWTKRSIENIGNQAVAVLRVAISYNDKNYNLMLSEITGKEVWQ